MPNIDHLSYSAISLYQSCSRAYKFRYIEKVSTPVATALVFGSAFHDTVEAAICNPLANIGTTWSEMWGKRAAQDNIEWGAETPESLHNEGLRLLNDAGVRETILGLKPLYDDNEQPIVERKVSLQVPGVPIPVIGFIDMVRWDGVPCDFKTAARSWENGRAGNEMQPLVYLAALNQEGVTHDWRFCHYVFVKTKKPQVQIIEHAHRPVEAFWLFDTIRNVWNAIQAGAFTENLSSWRCSAQYCEYWRWCRGKYG